MNTALKYAQTFLFPLLVPFLVGIGSAAITGSVMMVRLEERVGNLEQRMSRHESSLEKDLSRGESASAELARRTDDQERRLSRAESALEAMRDDVTEIKTDVKALLRGKL